MSLSVFFFLNVLCHFGLCLVVSVGKQRDDVVGFLQVFAKDGVSHTFLCIRLIVNDADGVSFLDAVVQTFDTFKVFLRFDDLTVNGFSAAVKCVGRESTKVLIEG